MAVPDFVKNSCNGVVTLIAHDGAGAEVSLVLAFDLGDLAITNLKRRLNASVKYQRRGKYVSTGHGERIYPTLTFTCYHTGEGTVAPGSARAFLMQNAPYDNLESVEGAGRPFSINAQFDIEGTDFGDDDDWSSLFEKCSVEPASFGEAMDGNKWSFTLECSGDISGDIVATEID